MEAWSKAWRDGFAPQLSAAGLEALRRALLNDDPRLLQGATTSPPPQPIINKPVEAACGVAFPFWQDGQGRNTVREVEEAFAKACFEADRRLGEPAACRYFLNWFDDTPCEEMRRLLLAEVNRELARRAVTEEEPVRDNEKVPF